MVGNIMENDPLYGHHRQMLISEHNLPRVRLLISRGVLRIIRLTRGIQSSLDFRPPYMFNLSRALGLNSCAIPKQDIRINSENQTVPQKPAEHRARSSIWACGAADLIW